MPTAEFFSQSGIMTVSNFLDRKICLRLREEIRAAQLLKGVDKGSEIHTDVPETDFTGPRIAAALSAASINLIEAALLNHLPKIEKYFRMTLSGIEPVYFVVYKKGCGFKPHLDVSPHSDGDGANRKVSIVIFLNQETDSASPPDSYCGGNLTFYGLTKNKVFDNFGLPLTGEQGLLVAFPSNILHEVTPVTAGERFVVVGWFL